jgi:hypothetical protein
LTVRRLERPALPQGSTEIDSLVAEGESLARLVATALKD